MIELGCAGGVAWFGMTYAMTGVDVSQSGLTLAAQKYDQCLRAADLYSIPDGTVDAVISSYFWEHISPVEKEKMLGEIHRVLKPGGHIVFLYDVETANPFIAWLRNLDPDLYRRLFIEGDGHIGYETIYANEDRFERNMFQVIASNPMERTPLQSASVYIKMKQWGGVPRLIGEILTVASSGILTKPWHGLLRIVDETFGRLFPRSWGRIAITVAAKRLP